VDAVYMLANQLPLIELASDGKKAARTIGIVSRSRFVKNLDTWLQAIESESATGDVEQICRDGLNKVQDDHKEWQSEITKMLDPAEHSAEVIKAQSVLDGTQHRIESLQRDLDSLAGILTANRSEEEALERDIESAKARQRELQGQVGESQTDKALADRQFSSARRDVDKLSEERGVLEAEKKRLADLRSRASSTTGEAVTAARLFGGQLQKTTLQLAELGAFRLDGSHASFQTRAENARGLLRGLQTARHNIDRRPSSVQVSGPALAALDSAIREAEKNLANLARTKATHHCDAHCKSLETSNLMETRKLHEIYATLKVRNQAMVDLHETLRRLGPQYEQRIGGLRIKVEKLAAAQAILATSQTEVNRSSTDFHKLQEQERAAEVELERLAARQLILRAQIEEHERERVRKQEAHANAEQTLLKNKSDLELARSESQAKGLIGQYAFRLLLYKDSSKERDEVLELIDARMSDRKDHEELGKQNALRCLKSLREQVEKQAPAPPKLPTFVAMNDPNDLLGYEIPDDLAKSYRTPFVNVALRLTNEYFRLFADPVGAHSRHARSKRAMRLIACGAKEGKGGRFVPASCTESAGVEQLSTSGGK
jgi:hypothetical protein